MSFVMRVNKHKKPSTLFEFCLSFEIEVPKLRFFEFSTLLLGIGRFGPEIRILHEKSDLEPGSEL